MFCLCCFFCWFFIFVFLFFFFFNDTATTEIYTLSLHDALPICAEAPGLAISVAHATGLARRADELGPDRKSTRLNSSHLGISYAVFCLKKKKNKKLVLFFLKQKMKNI